MIGNILIVHFDLNKDYSCLCIWMTSNWLEGNKILIPCGICQIILMWENQHHSLMMYTWDALKDNAKQAKILWKIIELCSNQEFPQEQRKNHQPGKNEHFYVVLRYGRSCKDTHGAELRVGKPNNSATPQILNSMSCWWPSIQRRRKEISICPMPIMFLKT